MSNLEKAKEVIKEYYNEAKHGIFDSRNSVGDHMTNIYYEDGLIIDICYDYCYFEVFGLSVEDFDELASYYASLRGAVI